MMKKLCSLLSVLVLCIALASCGGNSEGETTANKDLNLDELATSLLTEVTFKYDMEKLDTDTALGLYSASAADISYVCMYSAGGASADEIAIFKANSDDATARIYSAAEMRIESQTTSFVDYVPEEVPKLNDAVLLRSGQYIVLCVSETPDAANQIVQDFFK